MKLRRLKDQIENWRMSSEGLGFPRDRIEDFVLPGRLSKRQYEYHGRYAYFSNDRVGIDAWGLIQTWFVDRVLGNGFEADGRHTHSLVFTTRRDHGEELELGREIRHRFIGLDEQRSRTIYYMGHVRRKSPAFHNNLNMQIMEIEIEGTGQFNVIDQGGRNDFFQGQG
jgi:hypothetical protein